MVVTYTFNRLQSILGEHVEEQRPTLSSFYSYKPQSLKVTQPIYCTHGLAFNLSSFHLMLTRGSNYIYF